MNPNSKTWSFDVVHHGERAAGILGYSDTVKISVESGDPGGIEGEFEQFIRQCLVQWYDGARVELSNTQDEDLFDNGLHPAAKP